MDEPKQADEQGEISTRILAFHAGVTRLYHYEPFNKEYLAGTLRDYRIHCSNPANLNDPWDCRPSFNTSALREPNVRAKAIKWLQALPPSKPLLVDKDAYLTLQMYNIPSFPAKTISMISDAFRDIARQRWRIYCLTTHPDSTLMWSHYADNHRGICLEFAADNNPTFGQAWQVIYRGAYPRWSIFGMDNHLEIMITKSDDWQYENEYRIVARTDKDKFTPNPNMTFADGDFLALPEGSLLSVIAGCEADIRRSAQ